MKISNFKKSDTQKRIDCNVLQENGLFEEDQQFQFRMMSSLEMIETNEKTIKKFVKEMLRNSSKWILSKKANWYIYNFDNDSTGFIKAADYNQS